MSSENSKQAFIDAVLYSNESECKRLLDSHTFEVSFLVAVLDLSVQYGLHRTVKLLMEHGADPNTVRGVTVVQEAAITCTDSMLQSFIGGEGQMTPELRQLRGCYYLARRRYATAYEWFFPDAIDEDWQANKKKLVDRYCELMAQFKFPKYDLSCLNELVEHSDEDTWAQITTHLIRNTAMEFIQIRGMPLKNLFGFQNTCEVLETIVSSGRLLNGSFLTELIESVAQLIRYQLEDCLINREQQERMAEIVGRFRHKSQILTCCSVLSFSLNPMLEFLLEMCGCDPNERGTTGTYDEWRSLSGWFFENYYYNCTQVEDRTEEDEKMKCMLYRHGAHVCQTNYEYRPLYPGYWLPHETKPRRLDCLAARFVVESRADVSGLPKLVQDFVAKH